jgi:hypothetical protein
MAPIYQKFDEMKIEPPKSAFVVFRSQRIFREFLKKIKNSPLANLNR